MWAIYAAGRRIIMAVRANDLHPLLRRMGAPMTLPAQREPKTPDPHEHFSRMVNSYPALVSALQEALAIVASDESDLGAFSNRMNDWASKAQVALQQAGITEG
jgi:predicted component of type VI protein secretion system